MKSKTKKLTGTVHHVDLEGGYFTLRLAGAKSTNSMVAEPICAKPGSKPKSKAKSKTRALASALERRL